MTSFCTGIAYKFSRLSSLTEDSGKSPKPQVQFLWGGETWETAMGGKGKGPFCSHSSVHRTVLQSFSRLASIKLQTHKCRCIPPHSSAIVNPSGSLIPSDRKLIGRCLRVLKTVMHKTLLSWWWSAFFPSQKAWSFYWFLINGRDGQDKNVK